MSVEWHNQIKMQCPFYGHRPWLYHSGSDHLLMSQKEVKKSLGGRLLGAGIRNEGGCPTLPCDLGWNEQLIDGGGGQ